MTSQLILGNGHGLAVASDSAATYGDRTYEDATKIRGLKDPHRVAILQAGGVDLLGMPEQPREAVIAVDRYRARRDVADTFDTAEDVLYVDVTAMCFPHAFAGGFGSISLDKGVDIIADDVMPPVLEAGNVSLLQPGEGVTNSCI